MFSILCSLRVEIFCWGVRLDLELPMAVMSEKGSGGRKGTEYGLSPFPRAELCCI